MNAIRTMLPALSLAALAGCLPVDASQQEAPLANAILIPHTIGILVAGARTDTVRDEWLNYRQQDCMDLDVYDDTTAYQKTGNTSLPSHMKIRACHGAEYIELRRWTDTVYTVTPRKSADSLTQADSTTK